jgi:predicted Zn-dependent protease
MSVPCVHERLGDLARAQGRLDEAKRRYRLVLTFPGRMPSSGMAPVSLAELLLAEQRPGEATAVFRDAADHPNIILNLFPTMRATSSSPDASRFEGLLPRDS